MAESSPRTPDKYKAEIGITWLIVGIPLLYGLFNAMTAALQLFTA